MGTGTAAHGKKSGKVSHINCRRCGKKTYHISKKECSSCGYGKSPKLRSYKWQKESKR
ncbi:MAG: 50S ribosomal protein L37e [Candidatus Woesearchaeota archaeon]